VAFNGFDTKKLAKNPVTKYLNTCSLKLNMLSALITSRVRRDVLAVLFTHPEKEFYLRELARLTGGRVNAVRGELIRLESAGILKRKKLGVHLFYSANETCPIYPELKLIIEKTEGIPEVFRSKLSRVGGIKFAFIYGSFAAGAAKAGSDIDLMMVGSASPLDINPVVRSLESLSGREVNYSTYPEQEFLSKVNTGFIQNVLSSKRIMLVGGEDELKRFAKGWARQEGSGGPAAGERMPA